MLKHFVFCDAHIQSCSHQQSCGYWSGIFGEVFLRGSCSPGIQTKLMSWSQKHLVIPIRTACYRQQLYDTFCLSAVAIIYMYVSYMYSFFFTAKYVQFLLASFLRQKMLRLVLSWRSWTDTASTCFSDSAVRVKNTLARQIGKEWLCWLAENPCAKLSIKSHPVHGFSSFDV